MPEDPPTAPWGLALRFADGEDLALDCRAGESVLQAARRQGYALASECEEGICQTCQASLVEGRVAYDNEDALAIGPEERARGAVLCCVGRPQGDVAVRLPYTRASLLVARWHTIVVERVERLSPTVALLAARREGYEKFEFHPGQYVNLALPSAGAERAYSMASAPETAERVEFLVRLLPGGAMGDYLLHRAKAGDRLKMHGPHGVFYLRRIAGPIVMVAGGTGLAPMLSMLRSRIARGETEGAITLCFGVTARQDFFHGEELAALARRFKALELRLAMLRPDAPWPHAACTAVDLLTPADAEELRASGSAYLCGPPPMVEAARRWMSAQAIAPERVFAEEFQPASSPQP